MDIFFEQIVKKKKSVAEAATVALIYAAGLLLGIVIAVAAFVFVPAFLMFGLMLCILVFYGTIKLAGRFNIEYEYSVTNGTLDIDRIVNRSRRDRMVSAEIGEFDSFEEFHPEKYQQRSFEQKIIAPFDPSAEDKIYCAVTRLPAKGRTLIVFQPDERILEAEKKSLPPLVRREFQKS